MGHGKKVVAMHCIEFILLSPLWHHIGCWSVIYRQFDHLKAKNGCFCINIVLFHG